MSRFSDYEIEQQFAEFLRSIDAEPVGIHSFVFDGNIQRYRLSGDKSSEKSGSYCVYNEGELPAGWAKNWHNGETINWHFDTSGLEPEQRKHFSSSAFLAKQEELRKQREAREKERADKTAQWCADRVKLLHPAPEDHPYLLAKRICPYSALLENGGEYAGQNALAIPLTDIDGNIRSIQYILPNGDKRFEKNSKLEGVFWSIALDTLEGDEDDTILLGEGFATMAKVYELTGDPCVAGISCHFLKHIAEALRKKYPKARIVVMADNDKKTELARGSNPGIVHAEQLVKAGLANSFIYPEFQNPEDDSDWDDFTIKYGDDKTADLLSEKIEWERLTPKEKAEHSARKLLTSAVHNLDPSIDIPPQEFIGGLFPRNFVSILIAPPSTGKTIFMQKFVSDLSIGGSIFDGFAEDEPPRKCLILAGEAGYELLTRRGASMKWAINPERVQVVDQYEAEIKDISVMLDDPEGWQNVLRLVDMCKPDILFIDTLTSFHDSDENKAPEMKPIFKKLARLSRSCNMAVVPIHHSRKRAAKERSLSLNQDDVIGSSVINRLVGLIIGIEPMKDDEKILLVRSLKSWFHQFMPFTYTLKEGLYGGTVMQTDLAPANVNNSKIAVWNYLLSTFKVGEWFSRTQAVLSEIGNGVTESQLRRILAEFVKSGKLQRRGTTKASEYSITKNLSSGV